MLILLFPLAWPFVAKAIWRTRINWTEAFLQMGLCAVLVTVTWQLGTYSVTADIETWNGKILSKDRKHDHYEEPYECNCTTQTDSDGNEYETCDTCWEDRYTVTWSAQSTVGYIRFKHLDRGSRSVYREPDPGVYTRCKVGEPASQNMPYTNYVQAVPESLFNELAARDPAFAGKVPEYPRVHSFYKIDRVLDVGANLPSGVQSALDKGLDEALVNLGSRKQANILVIVTNIKDPSYRYAVENAWLGGEKNDIVVFLGVEGMDVVWVDVMTWALNSGNELFHVKLRDGLKEVGTLEDPGKVVSTIATLTERHFDRPQMRDFEYLKDAIQPPTWVLSLAIFFAIGGSLLLTFLFHRIEVDFFGRRSRFSNSRY